MQVSEVKLGQILEGTKQYQVPLYQRTYSWQKKHLERIWADIVELADARKANSKSTHFTGSLVLAIGNVGAGGSKLLVVDGQQRLTTLTILLSALRDLYKERYPDEPAKHESITVQYLVNQFAPETDRLKVLPTQGDREAYLGVVLGQVAGLPKSNVLDAYRFFRARLMGVLEGRGVDACEDIKTAVLTGLDFVSITASEGDNVYRIFESLNNTGLSLTQGDLLRNFIFMKLGDLGEQLYAATWMPMQDRLTPKDLEQLFWIELSWYKSEIKQGDIYAGQVSRMSVMSREQIRDTVIHFNELSVLLASMRNPAKEVHPGIRVALERLLAYGMTSTDPLVLRILELRRVNKVTTHDTVAALHVLESFLVRRLLVNAPHNALSRIMLRASDELDESDLALSLRRYLSFGRKRYATDDQVARAVVQEAFYYAGKPGQRKTILSWLERAIAGNEPAELGNTSIEHVMPQKFDLWREMLAQDSGEYESVDEMHDALVHTIANLTLTAYNSELSNRPFAEKQVKLATSNIALNQEIAKNSSWGRKEILARGERLAKLVADTWIAPVMSADNVGGVIDSIHLGDVITAIPTGTWATYGDVAAAIGSSPSAVEDYLSSNVLPGAWRVLRASGAVGSHKFASSEGDGDMREILAASGVDFDQIGHAVPEQRITVEALIAAITDGPGLEGDSDLDSRDPIEAIGARLAAALSPPVWIGVEALVRVWSAAGGVILVSAAAEQHAEVVLADSATGAVALMRQGATPPGQLRVTLSDGRDFTPIDYDVVDAIVGHLERALLTEDSLAEGAVAKYWMSGGREEMVAAINELASADRR